MKNRKIMTLTIAASLVLLALVAFAGTPGNQGYELFKEVLKSNVRQDVENGHITGTVKITDNGKTIAHIEGSFDGDEKSKEFSGDIKIVTDTLDKALSIYGNKEFMYILDTEKSEVYMGKHEPDADSEEYGSNRHDFEGYDEEDNKSEAILDFLVGDLAQEFELIKDTDGTTDILFELTKSEVPAIINLLTSQKTSHSPMDHKRVSFEEKIDYDAYPLLKELEATDVNFTELEDEIEVSYLAIRFDLDAQNEVEGFSFNMTVNGLDEKGAFHSIMIESDFMFSELGSAQVKTMNIEGMTVYALPNHKGQNGRDE